MSHFHNLAKTLKTMTAAADPGGRPMVKALASGHDVMAGVLLAGKDEAGLHRQPNHEEILVVLEGEAEFRVEDEVRQIRRGDLVFVPRGALHGPITRSDLFSVLSIFAPRVNLVKDVLWEREAPSYQIDTAPSS
jgi:quercetin dioxygenase-like cupin family protein